MLIHIYENDSSYWGAAQLDWIPRTGEFIRCKANDNTLVDIQIEQVVYDLQDEEPVVRVFTTIMRRKNEIKNSQKQNESEKSNQEDSQETCQTSQEGSGSESYNQIDEEGRPIKEKYTRGELIAARVIVLALWIAFLTFVFFMIKPRTIDTCPQQNNIQILPGTSDTPKINPPEDDDPDPPPPPHKGIYL